MFIFKRIKTGKCYAAGAGLDVEDPKDAIPKFGDQNSAFHYADEQFGGMPDAKVAFRRKYEIAEVPDTN